MLSPEKKLKKWQEQTQMRKRRVIKHHEKKYIDFSSNDYLGLSQHPEISQSFIEGIKTYGFGSGSSAFVSGYTDAHFELEQKFATWLGVDQAVLFSSGYHANIGVISALVNRSEVIIADRLCHASILAGIQLSQAQCYRYRHVDMKHLKSLCQLKKPKYIITESVFGMEGNITPIKELIQLSQDYQAGLIIDDAHGIGILGKNGGGICQHANLSPQQFSCLIMPLGKAFNGMGAMIAGSNDVMELILQFSKTYAYTTALPPAVCKALLASLKIIIEESWRREQLTKVIRCFIHHARQQGLTLISYDETPIKSIIIGDNLKTLALGNFLLANGFLVAAIRPPTVSKQSARLRISLNCLHREEEIIRLCACIAQGMQHVIT